MHAYKTCCISVMLFRSNFTNPLEPHSHCFILCCECMSTANLILLVEVLRNSIKIFCLHVENFLWTDLKLRILCVVMIHLFSVCFLVKDVIVRGNNSYSSYYSKGVLQGCLLPMMNRLEPGFLTKLCLHLHFFGHKQVSCYAVWALLKCVRKENLDTIPVTIIWRTVTDL